VPNGVPRGRFWRAIIVRSPRLTRWKHTASAGVRWPLRDYESRALPLSYGGGTLTRGVCVTRYFLSHSRAPPSLLDSVAFTLAAPGRADWEHDQSKDCGRTPSATIGDAMRFMTLALA